MTLQRNLPLLSISMGMPVVGHDGAVREAYGVEVVSPLHTPENRNAPFLSFKGDQLVAADTRADGEFAFDEADDRITRIGSNLPLDEEHWDQDHSSVSLHWHINGGDDFQDNAGWPIDGIVYKDHDSLCSELRPAAHDFFRKSGLRKGDMLLCGVYHSGDYHDPFETSYLMLARRVDGPLEQKRAASDLTAEQVGAMKVVELRAELQRRGMDTRGLKRELAARLTQALE